ncbi:MAG: bifunctional diaminohydroxyphosphoribosylaminopyrimidine deaminase/5-amino-6-(5-phosphoribosylamino)uracil reductase RibD [Pseudomonadota bacterium]
MSKSGQSGPDISIDARFMEAAIRLARKHQGWTATNPSVACLLVRDDGKGPFVVGSAVTAIGGRPHAEPIALEQAGNLASGATAYVTLEPCAHHGRTPPCAQTLIDAGVRRVVTAVVDPDERVNELGHKMLREAGVEVDTGICGSSASSDLAAYLKHKNFRKPWVTLKLAISKDGFIGVRGEGQVSISGDIAWAHTHMLRARNQAILIGSGTALADDPSLTCRLDGLEQHSPIRIVLDPEFKLGAESKLVKTARTVNTIIVSPESEDGREKLRSLGCEFMVGELVDGKIALPELVDDLGARGIMNILVEGGAAVAASFIDEKLVDEIVLYQSPVLLSEYQDAVASPVKFEDPPKEFKQVGELKLGDDLARRFRKQD